MASRRPILAIFGTCFVLVLLLGLAACGGDGGSAETSTETTTQTEVEGVGDAAAGAEVYSSAGCGSCHTLAAANSSGTIGPNLDELQPDVETVAQQVTNGGGAMPAFKDELTEQQIQDVAAYVAENAGS